jgi:hypothetical protein
MVDNFSVDFFAAFAFLSLFSKVFVVFYYLSYFDVAYISYF